MDTCKRLNRRCWLESTAFCIMCFFYQMPPFYPIWVIQAWIVVFPSGGWCCYLLGSTASDVSTASEQESDETASALSYRLLGLALF